MTLLLFLLLLDQLSLIRSTWPFILLHSDVDDDDDDDDIAAIVLITTTTTNNNNNNNN